MATRSKAKMLATADGGAGVGVQPEGLGGWLILIVLGQVAGIIRLLVDIGQAVEMYETHLPAAVNTVIALDAALLALLIVVAIAMFRKKRSFPLLWTYQAIAVVMFPAVLAFILASVLSLPFDSVFTVQTAGQMLPAAIAGAVWIWYLRVSVRVRNTFIH